MLTTDALVRSTASTSGVRRAAEGAGTARITASRRAGILDQQKNGTAQRLARGAQLALLRELGLDGAGFLGQVFQVLEVPGVVLLVELAALDVALDHAPVQVL